MEIGEPIRTIIVEPLEDPFRHDAPEETPPFERPVPVEPERELVPAGRR